MTRVISLFLLLALASADALSATTYFFFINGDSDYTGATYAEKKAKLIDQAQALYSKVKLQAEADVVNRYAIYFDPRGSSGLIRRLFGDGGRSTKFHYY